MEATLYILKVSALLCLFYAVYYFLLRSETQFSIIRHYFIVGIAVSFLLPLAIITNINYVTAPSINTLETFSAVPVSQLVTVAESPTISLFTIAMYLYLLVSSLLVCRFVFSLFGLLRFLSKQKPQRINNKKHIIVAEDIAPFSFFNYIVYNPKLHTETDLNMILLHEEIHAKHWHSFDVLLANILVCLLWINPFAWFYKKAVEQNLEFIADQKTVQKIVCKSDYQFAMVKASSPLAVSFITTNFHQSFIKKRIIMLNKNNTKPVKLFKMVAVLPLLALFLFSFNVKEENRYINTNSEIPNFEVTPATTDATLNTLAKKIEEQANNVQIRFSNRERNAAGELTHLTVETKFSRDSKFMQNMSYVTTENSPVIATFYIEIVQGEIQLSDKERSKIIRITENGLVTDALPIKTDENTSVENSNMFGDNPLYIINGKKYRKTELPKNTSIEVDGHIEAMDGEEGEKLFGKEGKDGVVTFIGKATFVPEKEKIVASKPNVNSQNSSEKINFSDFKVVISKNTTLEELKALKIMLKEKHQVDFNFSDVNYNENNEIVGIKITYTDGSGNTGNYNSSSTTPIRDIIFYKTKEGAIGLGNPKNERAEFVKEFEAAYGENEGTENRTERMKKAKLERVANMTERQQKIMEAQEERSELQNKLMEERKIEMEERRKEMEKLRSKMYEEAEKNVAIARSTNNSMSENVPANLKTITKDMTTADLEAIKTTFKADGIDFNYSNVKRNTANEITGIKITLENNKGSKSSSKVSSDNNEAIKSITVGMNKNVSVISSNQ